MASPNQPRPRGNYHMWMSTMMHICVQGRTTESVRYLYLLAQLAVGREYFTSQSVAVLRSPVCRTAQEGSYQNPCRRLRP
jgi:hypothetical protein